MIFVGGIHGVGKSFFCKKVQEKLACHIYSSSDIISNKKGVVFDKNKRTTGINANQEILLSEVDRLNAVSKRYLLDGHFCLLNEIENVEHLSIEVFQRLAPHAILLLIDNPDLIVNRLNSRDNVIYDLEQITNLQKEQVEFAYRTANLLEIPIFIASGAESFEDALEFVENQLGEE